jgi:CheY-like chemotaxis protein
MNAISFSALDPLHSHSSSRSLASVMIVDDDPSVLTVGKAILSTLPNPIHSATSGEAALERMAAMAESNELPALLVLDLTMPGGMSGLETLQAVQAIYPGIGVVACSGFLEESAHELCTALGFMDCIEKPYTTELLTSTVRRCLAKLNDPSQNTGAESSLNAE